MSDSTPAPKATQLAGQLGSQDTTQILQRLFTGHIVGQPAMGFAPLLANVQQVNGPAREVIVTVPSFDDNFGFTCRYEPHYYWNGSENVEATPPIPAPTPTQCLIVFPGNDPQGYGWVLGFIGWPTQ